MRTTTTTITTNGNHHPPSSPTTTLGRTGLPLPMQIGWIKVVKESRKPLAEYVCIHNPKLSRMGLILAIF
jgi:hypothetical protein